MKKVKKADLRTLIWGHYLNFIYQIPILEGSKQPFNKITVDVNSICISIYDDNEFDSQDDQNAFLQNFAIHIEAMTFENLKVIDMGCEVRDDKYFTWMHIANAYEVVE